jgi:hypothetical protein
MAWNGQPMPHSYRVTLQRQSADLSTDQDASLSFAVTNHDELFQLVKRVASLGILPEGEVAEFTIGVKLFSEIMLRHRDEPLFAELYPHFGNFMKRLKRQ